jgi:glycosyltransferase involved in cell wall biosynthesis
MSDGLVMVCDVDLGVPDATRTHTVEVARGFVAEGLAVDLVARGPDPRLPGVTFHAGGASEASRRERMTGVDRAAIALLRRRRGAARRCYVRHEWAQVPVLAAARALGYRVVTQVDDVAYGRGYAGEIGRGADLVRRAATVAMGRLAHGVVAVTAEIAQLLTEDFHVPAARIAVINNGVDVERFRPLDRSAALAAAGLDPEGDYVLFTGLFAPWVDFDTMLEGFAAAAADRPRARMLLVGDGPRGAEVDARIERLGLGDRVVRTGFVADRDRVSRLAGAATLALSATYPAYTTRIGVSPVKLAEYFAAGRAVVATDIPGVREAVRDSDAGIVTPVDPEAFGRAIGALLDDPERADALGRNGRRAAEERYSWPGVVRRTMPLFGAPLDRPRP